MIKAKDEVEEVLGQPDIPLSAAQRLTEKRTLAASRGAPHQKAHSGWGVTPRMRLYVRSLTKRRTLAVLEFAKCAFP